MIGSGPETPALACASVRFVFGKTLSWAVGLVLLHETYTKAGSPCLPAGDWAAPVLDSNRKLVALANDWCTYYYSRAARFGPSQVSPTLHDSACGQRDSQFKNLAYYADFIERASCALSRYALPFCDDLVCPADTRIMGYPFAGLPNGTGRVKFLRGFKPTRVTQSPPPGTVIGKNSAGNVTITAVDSSNRTLRCNWRVVVPPLAEIGQVTLNISVGTYNSSSSVFKQTSFAYTGSVFKMRGVVQDGLRGDGASARPRRKSGPTNGQITIGPNETKASVTYTNPIPVDFDFTKEELPDLSLEVEVLDNLEPNNGAVTLFGQIEVYW
jgi:hypothetical protein